MTANSWADFNAAIKECTNEKYLEQLLRNLLRAGGPRNRVVRVHGRLTKVRAHRERKELLERIDR